MNYKNYLFVLVLLIVNFPTVSGQIFGTSQLSFDVLVAPEKFLVDVKTVAISDFTGNKTLAKEVANKLSSYINKENRGASGKSTYIIGAKTDIFQIVDRERLNQVIKEQKLGVSGVVDENKSVEVGNILGCDAIIYGDIKYSYDDKTDSKKRKDKNDKVYYEYYLKRTVTVTASMKITSAETGEILATFTTTRHNYSSLKKERSRPSASNLTPHLQLAEETCGSIASGFVDYFTPRFTTYSFKLKKVKVKTYKKQAVAAKDWLYKGEVSKAYNIYNAIYEKDKYNANIAYNLGVVHEIVGNYDEAFECYSVAYQLNSNDKDIEKAYNRIKVCQQLVINLATIDVNIEPYNFEQSTGNELATKVQTRGNSKKRYDVFIEPVENSEIKTKVPGGVTFKVLKDIDGWYLIELLGGEKGYIEKKNTKIL